MRRRVVVTAAIGALGVGLGVAALVIALSVMNGYAGMIWDRQVGMNPHITVRRPYSERIEDYRLLMQIMSAHPDVVSAGPFIEAEGYVLGRTETAGAVTSGVRVRGVEGASAMGAMADYVTSGTLDLALQDTTGSRRVFGVVIGRALSEKIGATVGGDIRIVVAPRDAEAPMAQLPPLRRYIVTGIFDTGFYEFDAALIYVSLSAIQRDLAWDDWITGLHLRLRDAFEADRVSIELRDVLSQTFPDIFPSSWMYAQGNLYAWIWLQKWASFVVLCLIVIVAGFNMISILTMMVSEHRREIGILKALGATPKSIARIFTHEGLLIGACGVLLGNALGFALCWIQQTYAPISLSGDVYFINALPVDMQGFDFAMTSTLALLICYAFTRMPARRAAQLDPVQAIRYE